MMNEADIPHDLSETLDRQNNLLNDIKHHLHKQDKETLWTKWFSVGCVGISIIILGQAFRLSQQDLDPLSVSIVDIFLFAFGIVVVGLAAYKYNKQKLIMDNSSTFAKELVKMEINNLDELLVILKKWREEDKAFEFANKLETLAYVGFGFSLAMVGIYTANPILLNGYIGLAFFLVAISLLIISLSLKRKLVKRGS